MPDGFPGRFRNPEDRNPLSDPVGLREPGVRRRAVLAEVGAAVLAGCSRSAHRPVACQDRKSTRLNSSHANISYAVFCLKKKKPPPPSTRLPPPPLHPTQSH